MLLAARESLDDPTEGLDTCGGTLGRVHLERLFNAPLGRADLPGFLPEEFDGSCELASFPDPKLNGVLPDISSSAALVAVTEEPSICVAASCPTCCRPCASNPNACDPVSDETSCFPCSEDCSVGAVERCGLFDDFIRCEDGVY
jgi:hypothetical protein